MFILDLHWPEPEFAHHLEQRLKLMASDMIEACIKRYVFITLYLIYIIIVKKSIQIQTVKDLWEDILIKNQVISLSKYTSSSLLGRPDLYKSTGQRENDCSVYFAMFTVHTKETDELKARIGSNRSRAPVEPHLCHRFQLVPITS